MRCLTISLAALVAASACSDPTPASESDVADVDSRADLAATLEPSGLRLESRSSQRIYYLAYNPRSFALYTRCIGPQCPSVGPGEAVLQPGEEITGWSSSISEVRIEYWHLQPDGKGGFQADAIRTMMVRR